MHFHLSVSDSCCLPLGYFFWELKHFGSWMITFSLWPLGAWMMGPSLLHPQYTGMNLHLAS